MDGILFKQFAKMNIKSILKRESQIDKKVPSPNPKHGIKLSSSKAARVFPMIDIACS